MTPEDPQVCQWGTLKFHGLSSFSLFQWRPLEGTAAVVQRQQLGTWQTLGATPPGSVPAGAHFWWAKSLRTMGMGQFFLAKGAAKSDLFLKLRSNWIGGSNIDPCFAHKTQKYRLKSEGFLSWLKPQILADQQKLEIERMHWAVDQQKWWFNRQKWWFNQQKMVIQPAKMVIQPARDGAVINWNGSIMVYHRRQWACKNGWFRNNPFPLILNTPLGKLGLVGNFHIFWDHLWCV